MQMDVSYNDDCQPSHEPPELIITNTTIMNMCNGDELGSIDITSTGGTGGTFL